MQATLANNPQPAASPGGTLAQLARSVAHRVSGDPNTAPCFQGPDGNYLLIQPAQDLGVVHINIYGLGLNLVVLDGGIVRKLRDPEREPLRTDKIMDISDPAALVDVTSAIDYLRKIP
jgi:hypothetical protein